MKNPLRIDRAALTFEDGTVGRIEPAEHHYTAGVTVNGELAPAEMRKFAAALNAQAALIEKRAAEEMGR